VSITRYCSAARSASFAVGGSTPAGWVVFRVSIRLFLDQFNILFVESELNEFIPCFGSVISVKDDSLVLNIAARAQRFLELACKVSQRRFILGESVGFDNGHFSSGAMMSLQSYYEVL